MQTFLPYPDFAETARVLDNKRLGKQRVEVLQILKTLTGQSKGWQNHPAVKMWKGYENGLVEYGKAICREWISRGFRDTCFEKILQYEKDGGWQTPKWLWQNDFVCASHRAALLAKNPEWYAQFNWSEKPEINYIWPKG